jgi:uncharacterized protein (TIGR00725 family)
VIGPRVAVCGPGTGATDGECAWAEEVGGLLAEREAVLVCGGLGGVMEAACRGARSKLGLTVGLLPGDDIEEANGWVSLPVPTGMGEARNFMIVRAAQAVIAIGGGWGTLSEVAFALKRGTRVVSLGSFALDGVIAAGTPEEAVTLALAPA